MSDDVKIVNRALGKLGITRYIEALDEDSHEAETANEVYADLSKQSAHFKKIYDSMVAFRTEQLLWFQVAEKGFDDFMHGISRIK